jgi:hypothetical protein
MMSLGKIGSLSIGDSVCSESEALSWETGRHVVSVHGVDPCVEASGTQLQPIESLPVPDRRVTYHLQIWPN